ncbi:pre-mRNA-splicing factor cwc22 [Triticum aestivum]|uniref:pre-mRNA-splicing factor cwc22 n=1 Tax=Triticum aestivum TaxID=4565 RepID=UPI000843D64C|nr:pre-mRNA-splicing factor cwc22-like [Triticum aestivum]
MARPPLLSGGPIYVPPRQAAAVGHAVAGVADDKSGPAYQRRTWDALRASITGHVNKATPANIRHVLPELLAENLVRGRGLLCRALLKSQAACPAFTDVFAAIAAVVNSKIPAVGRLLLVRLVVRLRRAHVTGDKHQLAAAAMFVAHLVNQGVAHELLALELVEMLLAEPTDDGVEVAVGVVTECGAALGEACPREVDAVFDALRSILVDADVDRRIGFLIEGLFAVRRTQFRGHPPVRPELDLVEQEDQFTHQIEIPLEDSHVKQLDPEIHLDVFKPSATFLQDEAAYEDLKRSMLGDDGEHIEESEPNDDDDDFHREDMEMEVIKDGTATNLINLRRTIYQTIMSSAGAEEAGHKLLSIVRPGQEAELCAMLVECCKQERASSNTRFYGQLGQRLCRISRAYQAGFEACFARCYAAAHRMATDELRAAAGLFAHLLAADAVPWRNVLGGVRITEDDTTSSSRILMKVMFQEMAEQLGVRLLGRRMNDDDEPEVRDALFPRDSAESTRFAINFFTAIGLAGVTEPARRILLSETCGL